MGKPETRNQKLETGGSGRARRRWEVGWENPLIDPGAGARYSFGMKWIQKSLTLDPRPRGFHLITRDVLEAVPELRTLRAGMLQVFLRHTSASLTLNENASSDVRADFESHFNAYVPENASYYTHTLEGADDMPAHIKSSVLGASLLIPVEEGRPALGTWQGIYLCEHRDRGGPRSLLLTAWGEEAAHG